MKTISFILFLCVGVLSAQSTTLFEVDTPDSVVKFRNNGSTSNNGTQFLVGHKNTGFSAIYIDAANGDFSGLDYTLLKQNNDLSFEITNLDFSPIYFKTNGDLTSNIRLSIGANGNVGIGTVSASSKLEIKNGDVYIENSNRGVILTSPNGNCWRVTINNAGEFERTAISCP